MKKTLLLLVLLFGFTTFCPAQTLTYPEPDFPGQVLVIVDDNKTEQLVQESLISRQRSSTSKKIFGIGRNEISEMMLTTPRAYNRFKANDDIAFIVRGMDNQMDPMQVINIFEFKTKKKIRIAEYASVDTFGDVEVNTLNRQPFTARKFGDSSYLVILKVTKPGEYGITVNIPANLNVSTFGVDE